VDDHPLTIDVANLQVCQFVAARSGNGCQYHSPTARSHSPWGPVVRRRRRWKQ
jgi:hypothetical protein